MAQYPPLPIFNEDDEQIGEAMLPEILEEGYLHRVIHVMVEDEAGNVLLQFRGPKVGTNPNTWDFAAAGYVDPDESYEQAAKRELTEELGIERIELDDEGVIREQEIINGNAVNRFAGIFKVIIPPDTVFKLQEDEVAKVKWFTPAEIKELIKSNSNDVTPYFRRWLQGYYFAYEDNGN